MAMQTDRRTEGHDKSKIYHELRGAQKVLKSAYRHWEPNIPVGEYINSSGHSKQDSLGGV